jgi:hypothetical protein
MIINSSSNLYGQEGAGGNVSAPIALSLALSGEMAGNVRARVVRRSIALEAGLAGELVGQVRQHVIRRAISLGLNLSGGLTGGTQRLTSINLSLALSGELSGRVALALVIPEPILNETAENAFSSLSYAARLLGDNIEIPITSALIEASKGEIGKKVSCQIAKKQLSLITLDKTYTFQIGIRSSPLSAPEWQTILEDAPLDSRSLSRAWANRSPSDSLSFGAISPFADKLNRYPLVNTILYDPNKTEVSADEIEPLLDNNGDAIQTQAIAVSGLNLYHILERVRAACGFSALETNIPNYEIARADFLITQNYRASVAPFIGVFNPLYFTVSNVLWILDKTAAIPDEFEPRAIVADNVENLTVSIPSGARLDGFEVTYIDSNSAANFYVTRVEQTTEESGTFGDEQFTRTEIVRNFRDWKNTENADVVLRSELISETHSTYDNQLTLIGRTQETHVYDAQGKQKSSQRTVEAQVPNLVDEGTAALLTVRTETQTISYKPDPRNTLRFVQNKIVTQIRGLIAIDSENKYFDEDFKQDFVEANKAGNLTAEMTSEFGPIKTVTETLTSLGNGQYQVRVTTVDHVRNTTTNSLSEPRTGDATLSAVGGRSRKMIVWREGVTQENREGYPIEPVSAGEVPTAFFISLFQRLLERRAEGKQEGSVSVIGFDESLERGVFFTLEDRDESILGRFITEGYRVRLENLADPYNQKVTTEIECSEL